MNSIFDTFKLRAEAVSAEVHRFPHKAEALDFILQYLKDAGVADTPQSYAVWADCAFLEGVDKAQNRAGGSRAQLRSHARNRRAAKVGISQMEWAMANTGTLVQDAAAVERRLVSTLPNIHIALVQTDRILPDLPAVLPTSGRSRPITSPSSPAPAEPPTSNAC